MPTTHGALLKTLADPTRRALFERLCREGAQTVGALTTEAGISQPAVSKHLGVLKQAGLVRNRHEGRQTHYSARPKALMPLLDWTSQMAGFWEKQFDALEDGPMSEVTAAKQVLFVQGGGEGVHDEWDDKLAASLERELGPDYEVRYPRMPNEGDPSFSAWSAFLEREIAELDDGAFLVGHSVGGTILVHTLAQRPALLTHIAAIALVAAPFVGEGGWPSDEITADQDWAEPLAGVPVYLYQGDADSTVPIAHLDLYAKAIPHAQVRRLPSRDHQLNNDLSEAVKDIRRMT